MNTSLEKIEALENSLSRAVAGRLTALETINRRQTEAQNVIEGFASNPSPEQVAKVFAAHAALATGCELLARFGDLKSWQARLESAWTTSHQVELVALLEGLVNERAARRQAFRDAAGIELGRLTTAIVKADGDNAPDSELERLNGQLAAIEDDMAARENRLLAAANALKSFARATERPGAYFSLYQSWCQARAAAVRVDFSGPCEPEKTPA